jgi:hypothetical protein
MLRDHKLYAKLTKYGFLLKKIVFLGHVISMKGIFIDKKNESYIEMGKTYQCYKNLKFLGFN